MLNHAVIDFRDLPVIRIRPDSRRVSFPFVLLPDIILRRRPQRPCRGKINALNQVERLGQPLLPACDIAQLHGAVTLPPVPVIGGIFRNRLDIDRKRGLGVQRLNERGPANFTRRGGIACGLLHDNAEVHGQHRPRAFRAQRSQRPPEETAFPALLPLYIDNHFPKVFLRAVAPLAL